MRTALLFAFLMLLPACSSGPFRAAPAAPELVLVTAPEQPHEPPRNELILLGDYYGMTLAAPPADGTMLDAARLRALLEAEGFKVFAFSGNLGPTATGLRGNLEKGRPLLLLVAPDDEPRWILAVGLHDPEGLAIVQDRDGMLRAIAIADLEPIWQARDRMTILAVPRGSL